MGFKNSLYIPKSFLATASGINPNEILKDEKSGLLHFKNGFIWYRDALLYVFKKWDDGKVEMYPPYSKDPDQSFAGRVLSLLDDEVAVGNLKVEWTK